MYSRMASSRSRPLMKSTWLMVSGSTFFSSRMRSSITVLQAAMWAQVRSMHTGISVEMRSMSSRVGMRPSFMVSWFQPMPSR